jgi:hypothetical protein
VQSGSKFFFSVSDANSLAVRLGRAQCHLVVAAPSSHRLPRSKKGNKAVFSINRHPRSTQLPTDCPRPSPPSPLLLQLPHLRLPSLLRLPPSAPPHPSLPRSPPPQEQQQAPAAAEAASPSPAPLPAPSLEPDPPPRQTSSRSRRCSTSACCSRLLRRKCRVRGGGVAERAREDGSGRA